MLAGPACADGLVMTMGADGALHRGGRDDAAFSRHYGDAAQAEARPLLLFGASRAEGETAASPPSRARTPTAEVLTGIEATAVRYAGHRTLRRAGLSATDWLLLYQANIEVESGYDPVAVSPVGAIGLGQLMPGTAARLSVDPRDWQQNLDGSARYLLAFLEDPATRPGPG